MSPESGSGTKSGIGRYGTRLNNCKWLLRKVIVLSDMLRRRSDRLLRPLGVFLGRIGIRPNNLTFLGLALTIAAAWQLHGGDILPGVALMLLAGLADDVGIAPGARFGDLGDPVAPVERFGRPFGLPPDTDLVDDTVGYDEAVERGLARSSPVLLEHLRGIPGFEGAAAEGSGTVPVVRTRFHKPGLVDQLFHTAASAPVAYLLFLVGAGLLVFELFTAGVGIAGVIGAGSFLLGCYGLAVLPTRWWAIALLVVAMFGYAVDIQTGVPRAWTVIATASLVVGSVALYDGVGMSWITLGVGLVGMIAAMSAGMPAMVRTRFSTPTIGRDWMVGESGEAVDAVGPEGTVRVREAVWKARTNRATPIEAGAPIRVVAVEGLWLEVAPEEGGARDYRSRAPGD